MVASKWAYVQCGGGTGDCIGAVHDDAVVGTDVNRGTVGDNGVPVGVHSFANCCAVIGNLDKGSEDCWKWFGC